MQELWNTIQSSLFDSNLAIASVPLGRILLIVLILTITLFLRKVFSSLILSRIEHLTRGTETQLDDELIAILKQPLSWLIFVAGLWVVKFTLTDYLSPDLEVFFEEILTLTTIVIAAYIIYRSAPILGQILHYLTVHTETDLDDLLVPYLPRLFQTAAIVIVVIKASEVLLGASAGALIGLLGGAGVALGLLFKDIIYDWCCTVIIYVDNLYRSGDWVKISEIEGFVQVVDIGLRTTKLGIFESASIIKMPNSKMITGIVDNWSQHPDKDAFWGLNVTLKIDDIPADQAERIMFQLDQLLNSIKGVHKFFIRFTGIEQNARVFKIVAFVEHNLEAYFYCEKQLNLGILIIQKNEKIDYLSTLIICRGDVPAGTPEALQNN